jgi:DNA-binding GntR family transcriptional regulator
MSDANDIKRRVTAGARAAGAVPSAPEEPLSHLAYRRLRRDILAGKIEPGTKLKLDVLQELYGFSNTPLREALNRLAAEQIVTADGRRGFRASPVSVADFLDLTKLRLTLECSALADAIEHGDDDWEAGVVAALHRLEAARSRTARPLRLLDESWGLRHREFHLSLIASCSSKRMVTLAAEAFDQAGRYRLISSNGASRPRDAHDEHKELVRLSLARRSAEAAALLRRHIGKTADSVLIAMGSSKGSRQD